MSWKSLVSAGLLCVLAVPAFAAPTVAITNGGLDTDGNWVWNVTVTPTATGTPLASELGFKVTTGGGLVSAANAAPLVWDTNTPGNQIFTWETSYGNPLKPEGLQANCTGCTLTNGATAGGTTPTTVVAGALNEIFAALGSVDLTSGAATQYLTIKTAGPTDTNLTSAITLSGSYDGANKSGRISEITTGSNSVNYKGFTGVASRTLVAGDANLSGVGGPGAAVTLADLTILAGNLNKPGNFTWAQGDFNGTTTGNQVTLADLTILASNLNKAAQVGALSNLSKVGVQEGAGAGLGAGGAVPEPASVALIGLALIGSLGLVGRKR